MLSSLRCSGPVLHCRNIFLLCEERGPREGIKYIFKAVTYNKLKDSWMYTLNVWHGTEILKKLFLNFS